MFRLVFTSGSLKGRRFVVRGGSVTLGRGEGNTVPLPDESMVADSHVEIFWSAGRIRLRPLHPAMPVYVNDEPCTGEMVLSKDDEIRLGSVKLRCEEVMQSGAVTRRRISKTHALTITLVVLVVGLEAFLLMGTSWWSISPMPGGPMVPDAELEDPVLIAELPKLPGTPPADPGDQPGPDRPDPNPVPPETPNPGTDPGGGVTTPPETPIIPTPPEPEPEPEPEPSPYLIERVEDRVLAAGEDGTPPGLRILQVYLGREVEDSPVSEEDLHITASFFAVDADGQRVLLEENVPDPSDPPGRAVDLLGDAYYLLSAFDPQAASGLQYAGYTVQLLLGERVLDEVKAYVSPR